MDGHWHVQGPSALPLEQAPMVIVIVIAQEKVLLVEVAVAIEIRFPQGPRSPIHRFTAIHLAFDGVDEP